MANIEDWPAYVLELPTKETKSEDTLWLLNWILSVFSEYGLLISSSTPSFGENLFLYVTISPERLLDVSRKCRVRTVDGKLLYSYNHSQIDVSHKVSSSKDSESRALKKNLDSHKDFYGKDARDLFTSADILWMIRHEIDNVRSETKQILQVGNLKMTLFQGQSIVEKLLHKSLVSKIYPLHDQESLKRLGHSWLSKNPANLMKQLPLSDLRQYYGEGVGFYFAFLEMLTWALLAPSCIGLIHQFFPEHHFEIQTTFCVSYILWAFGFMELWKRRSNGLSFLWGTKSKYGGGLGEPRANYRGALMIDPISGQLQPYYPRWKTLIKLYGVSLPVVLLCTLAAFWMMLESIWKETLLMEWTATWPKDDIFWYLISSCVVSIPTIIYACLVWFANQLYRKLATKLTEWENHRTDSQFERNRVTKLLLFEFVNNFMSLFYIAFYLQDIAMLRWQVALMLLVFQVINQFTETLWPYVNQRLAFKKSAPDHKARDVDSDIVKALTRLNVRILDREHSHVRQAYMESLLEPYEGTLEDYLELYIQFGYVLLFVMAYPTASLWAWINNVAELRVDAFKLVKIHRRPTPIRVAHIGAWEPAFRMLCSLAVLTNCALLYVISNTDRSDTNASITEAVGDVKTEFSAGIDGSISQWTRAVICISLDHILLAIQSILSVLVPAVPQWVHINAAKRKAAQLEAVRQPQL